VSWLSKYAAVIAAIGSIAGPASAAIVTNLDDEPSATPPPPALAQPDRAPSAAPRDPCSEALDDVMDFTDEHPEAARELARPGDAPIHVEDPAAAAKCGDAEAFLERLEADGLQTW
jgi:hypothetical protein